MGRGAPDVMKRGWALAAIVAMAATLGWAQFSGGIYSGGNGGMAPPPPKKQPTSRALSGKILDKSENPLDGAVVYLKDTRTLAVRTYIANKDGGYQFNGLAFNQDYEIYAEHKGSRSGTKTLSAFDSRSAPTMNLHIEGKEKR